MAVLITGTAGFIGSHLADRLLARGEQVIGLDSFDSYYDPSLKRANLATALTHEAFSLVEADIRAARALDRAFACAPISQVVHLAARVGVRASVADPLSYADVNVTGTIAVLEACVRHSVNRLIFASSSSVYGLNARLPLSEDDPVTAPASPYAVTERAGELLCQAYHHLHGLSACCLRLFSVYGPRQRPDMAIARFVRALDRGEEIRLYGDGSSCRDYTFVDDVVAGLEAALSVDCGFEIINLGSSQPVALTEVVAALAAALGKAAQPVVSLEDPCEVKYTCADISKAARLLGYVPRVPLPEGIARYVDWYRRQQ